MSAMHKGETANTVRFECWGACQRDFFVRLDDRGAIDECPFCGSRDLGIQGITLDAQLDEEGDGNTPDRFEVEA